MAYPSGQAWGAVFITVGRPQNPPRPSVDLSACATLLVEIRGTPGTTLEIGVKDKDQPDDGNEQKVILPVFNGYRTYAIPLSMFSRAKLQQIYIPTEFVFGGPGDQTVWFRSIRYSSAPAPISSQVLNGASFLPGAGPGMWVSIKGQNLSTSSRAWEDRDFQGSRLPTALDGVRVNVNDRDMAVAYVSPTQINAMFFHDIPTGPSVYVSVTSSLGTSVPIRVAIPPTFPAFFTLSPRDGRYIAAVHLDGVIVGPQGLYGPNFTTRPAKPGDTILVFGTGFGPTSPLPVAGEIVPAPLSLPSAASLSVRVGGPRWPPLALQVWSGLGFINSI